MVPFERLSRIMLDDAADFLVQRFTEVHVLLYAFVGISACCIVGYLASFAFPPVSKSIAGLTIHTLSESYAAESGQTEGEMK